MAELSRGNAICLIPFRMVGECREHSPCHSGEQTIGEKRGKGRIVFWFGSRRFDVIYGLYRFTSVRFSRAKLLTIPLNLGNYDAKVLLKEKS